MYGSRTTFAIGATTKKGGLMFGQLTFFRTFAGKIIKHSHTDRMFLLLLDVDVLLWERNLDAVLVERVVDAAEHFADDV